MLPAVITIRRHVQHRAPELTPTTVSACDMVDADLATCVIWSIRWSSRHSAAGTMPAMRQQERSNTWRRRTGPSWPLRSTRRLLRLPGQPAHVRGRNGEREISWPTTEIKISELPDGRDLVLVQGLEPNLRWRQFSTRIMSALTSANAQRVHILGTLLADTPHTRPIPVSISTRDRELMEMYGLEPSSYEGPTGIVGVLADT